MLAVNGPLARLCLQRTGAGFDLSNRLKRQVQNLPPLGQAYFYDKALFWGKASLPAANPAASTACEARRNWLQ